MASVRPRRVLDSMPDYRPGAPAGSDDHKLSSNENPFGPLPGVVDAVTAQSARLNRYPDAASTALVASLASRWQLAPEQFAVGTGSVAVLYALVNAWCELGDEVVYAWRSFEAYPLAVDLAGATSVPVALRADAEHDLDAMADAVSERTRVVVVCSPNNPTGSVVTAAEFERFMRRVPPHVLVVLDEAYAEFVRDSAAVRGPEVLAQYANVVVLRTFSKAYGLAGLRVGYAVASAPIAAVIRKALPPFGVPDLSQAAACASLERSAEIDERVDRLVAERDRMVVALRTQGWSVPESQANFVWLPLVERGSDFAEHVAPVAVRVFGDGVRVSVGLPHINDEFLARAASFGDLAVGAGGTRRLSDLNSSE
jgi:histidinol-phosphate aminotransferase